MTFSRSKDLPALAGSGLFSLGKPRPPPNSGIYDGRGQSKLALPGNNTQWSVGVLEYWSVGFKNKEEVI